MREELAQLPDEECKRQLQVKIEAYCDAGHGSCVLREPWLARIVQETLFHDHLRTYTLHFWVVMPNHVHALFTPLPGFTLAKIMRTLKTVSAIKINRASGQSGRLWQPESFDRFIRSSDHFHGVSKYIEWNPVKAHLCQDPALFEWSSANENSRARLEFLSRDR